MKRGYFIGIDTHCQFCEIAVVNSVGEVVYRDRCDTSIAALLRIVESVRRPRSLVIVTAPGRLAGLSGSTLEWFTHVVALTLRLPSPGERLARPAGQ